MRRIYCIEILERDPNTNETVVKFRSPFDVISSDINISTLAELETAIQQIPDNPTRTATSCRLWFILNTQFPRNFYRIAMMNWKWDEEYYRTRGPSTAKGMDHSEEF